jgi:hypothetical protein
LLIIEVTYTNEHRDFSIEAGHLTPAMLQAELESFREIKGYLPEIATIHADPLEEKEMEAELAVVAGKLNTKIQLGRENMRLEI